MTTPADDPFMQIERAILQLGWLGQRQFMQLLAEERFDLTVPQYYTLLHLSYCSGMCKMSDLARATSQSAASLTGVVDRLLEKHLVERGRPDDDRRQVVVAATERGRILLTRIERARHEAMQTTLAHISPTELQELRRLLGAMLDAMGNALHQADRSVFPER